MRAEFAWSPFNGQHPQALPSSVRGRSRGHLLPQGEKAPVSFNGFPFGGSCRPQAADEGGVRVASLLTGSLRRLSPHPSAGGAADTFSPKGRRLLVSSKGFPFGGSCRPQAADEGGVCVASLLTGSLRRLSPHPSAGGAADTFSPKGRRLLSARSALIRPRRLGHLPPMGKAFMPAAPSHPQPASSRLPSSGRRSWCGPRSRSSGRWPYKRHPQTGRCTA